MMSPSLESGRRPEEPSFFVEKPETDNGTRVEYPSLNPDSAQEIDRLLALQLYEEVVRHPERREALEQQLRASLERLRSEYSDIAFPDDVPYDPLLQEMPHGAFMDGTVSYEKASSDPECNGKTDGTSFVVYGNKLSLDEVRKGVLKDGYLPAVVTTVLHEARHLQQYRQSPSVSWLSRVNVWKAEVDAMNPHPLSNPSGRFLKRPEPSIAAYQFPSKEDAIRLEQVFDALHTAGLRREEISRLVMGDRYEQDQFSEYFSYQGSDDDKRAREREAMDLLIKRISEDYQLDLSQSSVGQRIKREAAYRTACTDELSRIVLGAGKGMAEIQLTAQIVDITPDGRQLEMHLFDGPFSYASSSRSSVVVRRMENGSMQRVRRQYEYQDGAWFVRESELTEAEKTYLDTVASDRVSWDTSAYEQAFEDNEDLLGVLLEGLFEG